MRILTLTTAVSLALLSGCDSEQTSQTASEQSAALQLTTTTQTSYEDIGDGAFWHHATDASQSLLFTTLEADGIAVYRMDGEQAAQLPIGEVTGADVRYQIEESHRSGNSIDVLAVALPEEDAIGLYAIDAQSESLVDEIGKIALPLTAEGVCLYKNPISAELVMTATSEEGVALQYKLAYRDGAMVSVLNDEFGVPIAVREIRVGGELSACANDDTSGTLYIAEQDLGVWAYGADPESVFDRHLIDTLAPLGALQEIEGLDVIYRSEGHHYLAVADEGKGLTLYQTDDHKLVAQLSVTGFDEIKALAVGHDGLWLANSELDQPVYQKLSYASLTDVAGFGDEVFSQALSPANVAAEGVALIQVEGETAQVDDDGDAADDPALWVNAANPEQSLIIATNKQGGLMAYNLAGEELQYLNQGEPNNVDIRTLVNDQQQAVHVAAASNRDGNTIAFYAIQSPTDEIAPITPLTAIGSNLNADNGEVQSNLKEVYGLCLYQAPSGAGYVFINGKSGDIEQWRINLTAGGVAAELVRELNVPSQPEGCVADDETGTLYVGEENEGIWRFDAAENGATEGEMIIAIDGDVLTADVEGLSLYDDGNVKYLVASSQGSHSYAVFDIAQGYQVLSQFALVADDANGLDGASETDGIHVVATPLGDRYPHGIFIVQDGYNVDGNYQQQNQNFKMVGWQHIEATFD